MTTMNTVLMMILCAMIGFAIGNAWGQIKIKRLFSTLIEQLTNGLKASLKEAENKKEE